MVTGRFKTYMLEPPFNDQFEDNEQIVSAILDHECRVLDVVVWVPDD